MHKYHPSGSLVPLLFQPTPPIKAKTLFMLIGCRQITVANYKSFMFARELPVTELEKYLSGNGFL